MGAARAGAAEIPRSARADQARRPNGLSHQLARRTPLPRRALTLPGPRGAHRRSEPDHREPAAGFRRHPHAPRVHPSDASRREGGDGRHLVERPDRVGYRPVDSHGTNRVRRRPRGQPRAMGGSDRSRGGHVGVGVLRVPRQVPGLSAPHGHSKTGAGSSSPVLDGSHLRRQRRDCRGEGPGAAVVLDHAAARANGRPDPPVPRGSRQPHTDHPSHDQQGCRLHARALRRLDGRV